MKLFSMSFTRETFNYSCDTKQHDYMQITDGTGDFKFTGREFES